MDDAALVRRFQPSGDLARQPERLPDGGRAAQQQVRQRLPRHQFHHERVHALRLFQFVDRGDVRVIERRQGPRFAPEPREPIGIGGDGVRQALDGDVPLEARVARAVHLAHSTGADGGKNLVGAESGPGGQSHDAVRQAYRSPVPRREESEEARPPSG